MNQINIHKRKTDLAWEKLHARLEEDGLLSGYDRKPPVSIRNRAVGWAAAIAVLCISVVTLYYVTRGSSFGADYLTLQNADASTTLVTTLEDGSIVYLAEKATLHYPEHFEANKRMVGLEGNAMFDVSGNKERPFLIETEKVRIEVLGTSFEVHNTPSTPFALSVRRGEVRVTDKEKQEDCLVRTGQTVTLLPTGLQVSKYKSSDIFAQYTHYMRFKDERLGDILRILNQESPDIQFRTTPELEDMMLTVTFGNETAEERAILICTYYALRYTYENNILLIASP